MTNEQLTANREIVDMLDNADEYDLYMLKDWGIERLYYNPDCESGAQMVKDCFAFCDICDAFAAYEDDVESFFEDIADNRREYCMDWDEDEVSTTSYGLDDDGKLCIEINCND